MKLYSCCHLSKDYLFFTLSVINSSSLVKLPALESINKHSLPKAVCLKGLALYKKLTFQRLTFMPNQEYNCLTFKSLSIHVFWHFYSKVVHFRRLPASRERFKDCFSLCWFCCIDTVSSFSLFQWSALVQVCIGCRLLAEGDFEAGQHLERMDMVNTKRIYSFTPACAEHELVFNLHSKQNERWEMPCAGR